MIRRWFFKWLWLLLLCIGLYLAVPLAVFAIRSAPTDPFTADTWQPETVTSVGTSCMRARARHTLSFVPRPGVLCEIGPGRGILAIEAKKQGLSYWAIDMDATALSHILAEKKFVCRVPPMPEFPDVPVAIVIESVLEHMKDSQEVSELLSQCYERLAWRGILVIRVPEIRYAKWRFWDCAPDHTYVTSLRRLTTLTRSAGFTINRDGYYLDQFTGLSAQLVYRFKSLWPWDLLHDVFYEPWQESAFSKIAEKVPGCYIIAQKNR